MFYRRHGAPPERLILVLVSRYKHLAALRPGEIWYRAKNIRGAAAKDRFWYRAISIWPRCGQERFWYRAINIRGAAASTAACNTYYLTTHQEV